MGLQMGKSCEKRGKRKSNLLRKGGLYPTGTHRLRSGARAVGLQTRGSFPGLVCRCSGCFLYLDSMSFLNLRNFSSVILLKICSIIIDPGFYSFTYTHNLKVWPFHDPP